MRRELLRSAHVRAWASRGRFGNGREESIRSVVYRASELLRIDDDELNVF